MASTDFESSEFDLVVTSVRLIRVGSVVQGVFSRKLSAKLFYAETAARFKRAEEDSKQ